MDDDFGGEFFENEDYGAFLDDENAVGAGEVGLEDTQALAALSAAAAQTKFTTSDPLETDGDIVLPSVKVVNCVACFHTDCELDLRLITISTRNIEYNPRRANSAVLRFVKPRLSALITSSGRVTICGSATLAEIKKTAKLTAKIIQRAGHPQTRFTEFKISTLVCTAQ